jgi:phosphoserine phosphatase
LLNTNQFYCYKSGTVNSNNDEIDFSGLTKLSLFKKSSSHDFNVDESEIINLFDSINTDFVFRKTFEDELLLWELYSDEVELKKLIQSKIKLIHYDYVLWPKEHLKSPKLLVFDMDSTFIKIEVIDELAKRHGVGELVSKVTESAMRGELDFSESLISRVLCLKGLKESNINSICQSLPLSSGVEELVEKSNNIEVAIVSGGFTPFVEFLQKTMSLYKVKANNLEIKDEELTGKVLGKIVDANEKALFIRQLQKELGLTKNDIMAIGDGANDLLMMEESGFSLAYRAKPAVQAKAKGIMNITDLNHLLNIFSL